ncbi:hypothetical protein ACXGQW_07680 [Wenyingzhuangia sp. IMCC45533]
MMKKSKEIIIGVLLLIIVGAVICIYNLNTENKIFKEEVLAEKNALEKDLELTIKDLNSNQEQNIAITKDFNQANDKLKKIRKELKKSKSEIISLKRSLVTSEKSSFKDLQLLRNKLESVKLNNQLLYKTIDSIKTLNDSLMVTIAVTKSELNAEKLQSKELSVKLSEATKIQIAKVEVFAVEEKKTGKVKQTNRSKNVNGIQVKYNILNNKALADTECDIYYVLKDNKGVTIITNGEFLYNDVSKKFTDGTRVVLNGETMPVSDIISLQDNTLSKGVYTLEFYSNDGLLAKESFELKNGFLGVF